MKTHESAEDYLERILMLTESNPEVHAVDVAASLGFSKPSVSIAMKKLEDQGYVRVGSHQELILTKEGREIAEKIYERHNILGSLFVSLGVDEKVAYEDACRIEHDLSDETFAALKRHFAEKKADQ